MPRSSGNGISDRASSLRELESLDPGAIRARVVDTIHRLTRGRHAAFYSIRELDGALRATNLVYSVSVAQVIFRCEIASLTWPSPYFDPRRPPRASDTQFRSGADTPGWDRMRRSEVFQQLLGRMGVEDQLRTYVYHGDRFVGWLGVMNEPGDEPFTRQEAARLDGVLSAARAALVAADAAEHALVAPAGADLVVRPDGSVEYASAAARALLAIPGFIDELRTAIRQLEQDERARAPLLRCAHAVYTRLHGTGSHRYLVHLSLPSSVSRDPLSRLTPAQRGVAERLAVGATIDETARDLEVSSETVRTHLKAVYRKLEIASRAELARLMNS